MCSSDLSKEDYDGSKTRNKLLGERQRLKIPESLKPGVYYVRDTSENQRYEVTVRCKFLIFYSKTFFDRDRRAPAKDLGTGPNSEPVDVRGAQPRPETPVQLQVLHDLQHRLRPHHASDAGQPSEGYP